MRPTAVARRSFVIGDFPGWLPAMLVKELRQGLHTRGFISILVVFHTVMVATMATTMSGLQNASPAARAAAGATTNQFFWTLLAVMLLLVIPARALSGLRGEMDSRTLDLLVLTDLTAWRIVLGKWASLIAQGLLLLIAMLPYGIVRYFAGSADLVADAGRYVALLGGCALLTAAGLWLSGLPKVVAIPFAVAFVYGQGFGAFRSAAGAASYAGPLNFGGGNLALTGFDGALLLLFFLLAAVRRIAPMAENYSSLTRLLALPAFLAALLLGATGAGDMGRTQLGFATVFLILICAVDLSSSRRPMLVHWEGFAERGWAGRLAGPFLLPGWPSALAFVFAAVGLYLALLTWGGLYGTADRDWFARLAWLAATGLAFPAVVISFLPRSSTSAGAYYGATLGILCFLAVITTAFSSAPIMPKWWLDVAAVIPISAFWIAFTRGAPEPTIAALQNLVAAIILAVALWQTRAYWRHISSLNRRIRR